MDIPALSNLRLGWQSSIMINTQHISNKHEL